MRTSGSGPEARVSGGSRAGSAAESAVAFAGAQAARAADTAAHASRRVIAAAMPPGPRSRYLPLTEEDSLQGTELGERSADLLLSAESQEQTLSGVLGVDEAEVEEGTEAVVGGDVVSDADIADATHVLALIERLSHNQEQLLRELDAMDPAPDSVAGIVLTLLLSGVDVDDLTPQLRADVSAASPISPLAHADAHPDHRRSDLDSSDGVDSVEAAGRHTSRGAHATASSYARLPLGEPHSAPSQPLLPREGWLSLARLGFGSGYYRVCLWVLGVCVFVLLLAVGVWFSIDFLPPLCFGLDHASIFVGIGHRVYTQAGVHLLGLGHTFVLVPATLQTTTFGSTDDDQFPGRIYARSHDGLTLRIAASVMWRYSEDGVRRLFLELPPSGVGVHEGMRELVRARRPVRPAWRVLRSVMVTGVQELVAEEGMHRFFDEKEKMGEELQRRLEERLSRYGVILEAAQLLHVSLPLPVDQSLMGTAQARLGILHAQKHKAVSVVEFATERMAAEYQRTVTVQLARGAAARRAELARANAVRTRQTVQAELRAYANLSTDLYVGPRELLQYTAYDQVVGRAGGDAVCQLGRAGGDGVCELSKVLVSPHLLRDRVQEQPRRRLASRLVLK